jgi:hypothetical protein
MKRHRWEGREMKLREVIERCFWHLVSSCRGVFTYIDILQELEWYALHKACMNHVSELPDDNGRGKGCREGFEMRRSVGV